MSTPDKRARDKDRDAAIEVVEAAWADGQIVGADRDRRVEELLRAQTLAEIEMFVHDLQPPAAPTPAPPEVPAAVPVVAYGPPSTPAAPSARAGRTPPAAARALLVVPLVVLVVVVVSVVAGVLALVRTATDAGSASGPSGTTYAPGVEPTGADVNVLSVRGYGDLVAAVEEATGSSAAFSTVLYPAYAVLDLPVDATSRREQSWYWNGELSENSSKGTSTEDRFDLRKIDPDVVVRLVTKVRRLVDEPTSWYAVIRAPDDDGAMILAYASNDYHESTYLAARRDGTITYNSTQH